MAGSSLRFRWLLVVAAIMVMSVTYLLGVAHHGHDQAKPVHAIPKIVRSVPRQQANAPVPVAVKPPPPITTTATTTTTTTTAAPPQAVPKGPQPGQPGGRGLLPCAESSETVFWKTPTDADQKWVSPFKAPDERKYVTFEPDYGGWNNIRMSMESVMVFAHATGRTLVMPPPQVHYLISKGWVPPGAKAGDRKVKHGFGDFFHIDRASAQMDIMETNEFLAEVGMKGLLKEKPRSVDIEGHELHGYLRRAGQEIPPWDPITHCLIFPEKLGKPFEEHSEEEKARIKKHCGRRKLYTFVGNNDLGKERVLHFPMDAPRGYRFLGHFYTFMYFADHHMERHIKRFIRDLMHYQDEIFCAASRIIEMVRADAAASNGTYDAFHIRRGDFQYKFTRIGAPEIITNIGDKLEPGMTVYVSTDEKDKNFFQPLLDFGLRLKFLGDYEERAGLKNINPNWYGMIESIVAARGRRFYGCWMSTFTGYITRMRGYYGRDRQSWYYAPREKKEALSSYTEIADPYYNREFPTAWENIDQP